MSARVAIAAGYFPAYARLPRKVQRKADEFIRKFSTDPTQPSLHYEPVSSAVDRQLRSVRIGDDYRAIVRAPEQGKVFVLLWVDHHDEAYRWAESKQVQAHPATGTLQVFDVDAASRVVTDIDAADDLEADDEAADCEEKRLLSDFTDDQLFAGGLPRPLIPAVRALYTDADLDRLVTHLPQEAADLLTGLAAGYAYDAVLEQILDGPPAAPAAPDTSKPPTVPPTAELAGEQVDPIAVALGRESTQREFRLLDASFDLEKALSYPLDIWRVYLHPSQRKVVRARTKGPVRVTGGAGTGKTVVVMHRAAFLAREVFGRRSRELRINYRTTAAICRWAFRTLGGAEFDDLDDGKVRGKGYVSLRAGEKPIVRHFSNAAEEYAFVVGEIRQLLEQGVHPESICVVARLGNLLSDGIGPALAKAGIDHEILDKNKPRTGCVRLATMHRVKGLEFPVVFVTCVNDGILPLATLVESDDPVVAEQAHARERCLLYVAASRARDTLYVVSHGTRSPLLEGLDELDVASTREEARARSSPPEASAFPLAKPAEAAAEPVSGSDAERDPLATLLAEPVNSWPLPVRILNWCEHKEILSVRELVSYSPVELLNERNVGRKTVAETRVLVEARLGATWEEARRFVRGEQALAADGARAEPVRFRSAWDRIRAELPVAFADTPVAELGLPARMESYCSRQGILSLAGLVKVERSVLLAAKNVGRTTVATTEKAVLEFIETSEARRAAWSEGLLSSWKAWMRDLDTIPRMILARRAGLAGEPETLDSIGETLGVSRERIRQIEAKQNKELQAQAGWKEFVLERFRQRLDRAGAVPLAALEADPWWTGLGEQPQVLIYFCKRLLDDAFTVVTVGETNYLAAAAQPVVDAAWSRLLEVAEAEPLPVPLTRFEGLARRQAEALGPVLAEALFDQLQDHLQLDDPSLSAPTVLAFGAGKRSQVIALLAASDTPLPVNELVARVGRFNLPDDLLYFDRNLVGLKQHFPDFDVWLEKIVPVVVSVMESSGADRQWSCMELIDDVREALEIPEWMNHWHLSSLLRNSNRVTYLGRFRVALPGVAEVGGRVRVREHLRMILQETGAPLSADELLGRARKAMDFNDSHARLTMLRAPFLKCDEDAWGLTERDLPGGSEAADAAIEHIETILQRRERGLTAYQVQRQLQTLSASHAQWTQAMCLSVLRGSPALRLSHGGNVGLSEWDTVRVPSRTDLIAGCLDEGGGRVSFEAIQARIEALYGSRPSRADVTGMAAKARGRMMGEWVVLEGVDGAA